MSLAKTVPKKEIEDLGEIRFHSLGDSGVNHAVEAEQVADEMALDFQAGAGALNLLFSSI